MFGKYDWLFFPQYRIFIKFFVFSFSPGYRAFWSSSYLMLQFKAAKHYKGHVIEGKIEGRLEVKEGRRKRRNQLLGDITENRGYWKLKEETLDHPLSWTRFGRGYRPVVRQTTEWMNEWIFTSIKPKRGKLMEYHEIEFCWIQSSAASVHSNISLNDVSCVCRHDVLS